MKVLTNNQYYSQIADVIREQNGTNNTYKPAQMVSALKDLFYEEVEGVPPISFNGIGENLLDYRIDGASGGVGERTSNLVDKTKFMYGYRLSTTGTLYTTPSEQNLFAVSEFIKVNSGEQYIISQRDATRGYARRISFYQSKNENSWLSNNDDSDLIFTVPNTATYLKFTTLQNYIDSIMLIRGTSLPTTYEPYGYKVPVVISGKNLFNEITYQGAVNNQGNIVDSTKRIRSEYIDVDENETYTCSSNLKIRIIYAYNNEYNKVECIYDAPLGKKVATFVMPIGATKIMISFMDAGDPNNEITPNDFLWGQLEKGSIATDYEPYHEPTITNIYLDEPIEENESISLSDTNTNIPTIRGTNVLTVDTTVQPSNVYVKSRHESSYETAMRERYESIIADYEQQLASIESSLQEV